MNKWLGVAMAAVVLQAGMPAAQAARTTASMDVSFRVVEACAIRTTATAKDAEVHCQYQTPYQLQAGARTPDGNATEAPRRAERPADADAPAALTIWF